MKRLIQLLWLLPFLALTAHAEVIEFRWQEATTNDNGSALNPAHIKTYTVRVKNEAGQVIATGQSRHPPLDVPVEPGPYTATISTTNIADREGPQSPPISIMAIAGAPSCPAVFEGAAR